MVSIIAWIIRFLKIHLESETLDIQLNKIPNNLSIKYLTIAFLWKFTAIVSIIFSFVLLLSFLWIHLLFTGEFGNYRLENLTITKHDFLTKLSNLEEPIKAKSYLYLLPLSLFVVPVVVNIWAKNKYIGFKNEYSIANAILLCFIPTRYVLSITYLSFDCNIFWDKIKSLQKMFYYSLLHPVDKNKTGRFLFCNQISNATTHALVWISYSIIELSLSNGKYRSALVLRFLVPSVVPLILIPTCICVIHWSINIR